MDFHSAKRSPRAASADWADIAPKLGQNAISILLQPPMTQTGLLPVPTWNAHKPPSSRDIPPVTLSSIAQVDAAEFQSYVARVGTLYEQLRRISDGGDGAGHAFHGSDGEADESSTAIHQGGRRLSQQLFVKKRPSTSSFSHVEAPHATPISRSASATRWAHAPSPLSSIPSVYFDKDFHLGNPRIFDVVTERAEITQPLPPRSNAPTLAVQGAAVAPRRKALATNAILQEKLSWYMDTIETHLVASSSAASSTFFTVLGSLQTLHAETIDSVEKIKGLRKELQYLDEAIVNSGLTVIQKRQRSKNIQQLHDAISQVKHVVDSIASCEDFIDSGELDKALESIESLEKVIVGESDRLTTPLSVDGRNLTLRDLRGVPALQGLDDDLSTLRLRVGRAYETQFINLLLGDLRHHVDTVSTHEVLMRWSSATARSRGSQASDSLAVPSYLGSTESLRSELLETVIGLHRAKHLTAAATVYKQAALKELRSVIRRPLPSSNDEDNASMSSVVSGNRRLPQQQKSSILARNLRSLEPESAEEMLIKIYINATEMLRRLTAQVKLLLDVASTMGDDSVSSGSESPNVESPSSGSAARRTSVGALEMQEIHKAIDLTNVLGEAVDIAQEKVVKILRIRAEQSTRLSLTWFLRYFTLNLYFANECESISGRSGAALKTVVNSHIKAFLQQHAGTQEERLTQAMDSDKWEAKDFSDKDTAELQRIISSSLGDPAEWLDGLKIWIPHPNNDIDPHRPTEPQPGSDGKTKTRSASIDGELFLLPNSAILCMHGVSQFLQLIVGIRSMASEIGLSLVSYIQLFNARCEQLILGAEARRSAGLKSITSKHLVLASQALAFTAAVVGSACELVRHHTAMGASDLAVTGLDKAKTLCQAHQSSIDDKLVDIMMSLAAAHTTAVTSIDWENSSEDVHPYMTALVKDTTSLYRVLTRHAPDATMHMLMSRVFLCYKDQFGKAFQGIHPKTEVGRESMLRDVECFEVALGKMAGCGSTGEYLAAIIHAKKIEDAAPDASAVSKGEEGDV